MKENNSHHSHILTTSSHMMGLCFVVLTSIDVLKLKDASFIDELTTLAIVLFMISSVISFISMRSANAPGERYERIADFVFLSGLACIFFITMLLFFNVIK